MVPLRELILASTWKPSQGQFGLYPFISGTLWVTLVAMIIALPPCLLSAIYLSDYATKRLLAAIKPVLDLLAGIPSVVYGVWGVIVVVPLVRDLLVPWLSTSRLGGVRLLRPDNFSGYSILAASVVLAVMILPVIVSVTHEVFRAVPAELREASLSLGATRWQTVKFVVLRKGLAGMMAAAVLGLSRALGETMAVLMVAGNVPKVPSSLLDPAYPLPALIANNYGEMLSIPLYDSALMSAALVLLTVVLLLNLGARLVLIQVARGMA